MACWIHGSIERGDLEESEDCRFHLSELADLQKELAARGLPRDLLVVATVKESPTLL